MENTRTWSARPGHDRVTLALVVLVIIALIWSGQAELLLVVVILPLVKDLITRSLSECRTCQA